MHKNKNMKRLRLSSSTLRVLTRFGGSYGDLPCSPTSNSCSAEPTCFPPPPWKYLAVLFCISVVSCAVEMSVPDETTAMQDFQSCCVPDDSNGFDCTGQTICDGGGTGSSTDCGSSQPPAGCTTTSCTQNAMGNLLCVGVCGTSGSFCGTLGSCEWEPPAGCR